MNPDITPNDLAGLQKLYETMPQRLEILGAVLASVRQQHNVSVGALAARIHVPVDRWQAIERGLVSIDVEEMWLVGREFGLEPEQLWLEWEAAQEAAGLEVPGRRGENAMTDAQWEELEEEVLGELLLVYGDAESV